VARVLVLDDEDEVRSVLMRTLQRAGHEALGAANGLEGLQVARTQPLDLVVTDLVMPEVDGLEFIRELGRLRPGMPVIAISGGGVWDARSLLTVAGTLGALRTMSKPFELAEFLSLVAEVLATGVPPGGKPDAPK
jgi:DNA-binding NtrC family response regulator